MSSKSDSSTLFNTIISDLQACTHCQADLPLPPKPVFQLAQGAKILIAGQAPGVRAHRSGLAFDDPSGDRLRMWLGVDKNTFYDPSNFAIMPMAFCYPGTGASGDLAPPKACVQLWRSKLLAAMPQVELTLLIGQYAQKWHLPERQKTLTATVKHWQAYAPKYIPLPHPSPRNNRWLAKNHWFEQQLIPILQTNVARILT